MPTYNHEGTYHAGVEVRNDNKRKLKVFSRGHIHKQSMVLALTASTSGEGPT